MTEQRSIRGTGAPIQLDADGVAFTTERHLATLTTMRPDGTPHVAPVGFTWDQEEGIVRVITWATAFKTRNAERGRPQRAAVCQVDGGRWMTLEGPVRVATDPRRCADAERRYANRYQDPRSRSDRVVIEISVDRAMGRW